MSALHKKALREAERLFRIFDGTRTFVIDTWILGELLAAAKERDELRQFKRRTMKLLKGDADALEFVLAPPRKRAKPTTCPESSLVAWGAQLSQKRKRAKR